jgi:hypothetical protein
MTALRKHPAENNGQAEPDDPKSAALTAGGKTSTGFLETDAQAPLEIDRNRC